MEGRKEGKEERRGKLKREGAAAAAGDPMGVRAACGPLATGLVEGVLGSGIQSNIDLVRTKALLACPCGCYPGYEGTLCFWWTVSPFQLSSQREGSDSL